jgi:hypothetical protein
MRGRRTRDPRTTVRCQRAPETNCLTSPAESQSQRRTRRRGKAPPNQSPPAQRITLPLLLAGALYVLTRCNRTPHSTATYHATGYPQC